ncbi:hypothetical protein GCM10017562_02600 [Streptomyces roseofulvus]
MTVPPATSAFDITLEETFRSTQVWTRAGCRVRQHASTGRGSGGLIGREHESAELRRLLAEHRLVTVTGGPAVGKSRLAATVVAAMPSGPWECVIQVRWQGAAAGGRDALLAELAKTVTGWPTPWKAADFGHVVRGFPPAPVLLFLDDVDPVHTEAMGLVQRLLIAHPRLRVLVTSRRVLGLGDEHVLRLAPLSVEARGEGTNRPSPAVELFLARVRATATDFRAEGAALEHATRICRLVEGNPLAIELAAEQTAHRPLDDLAERLGRHQGWLHSPHPIPRRHRSLREAVGASYVLCERELRVVWGRASVLEGWFTEATAALVCAGGAIEPQLVPAYLARLAAAGVLEPSHAPGGPRPVRHRMTRVAREFGLERLREAGEFSTAADRRLAHCRNTAAVAAYLWDTGSQEQAVGLLTGELDTFASAVRHAVDEPDHVETALEAVVSLWFLWVAYHRVEEGRDHLLRLLPLCPEDHPLAVRGHWLAAWLTAYSDTATARALLDRAWPAAVLAGDDAAIGRIAHVQGVVALHERDAQAAAAHFQEAADIIPAEASGGPSPAVSQAALAVTQACFDPVAAPRDMWPPPGTDRLPGS